MISPVASLLILRVPGPADVSNHATLAVLQARRKKNSVLKCPVLLRKSSYAGSPDERWTIVEVLHLREIERTACAGSLPSREGQRNASGTTERGTDSEPPRSKR